MGLQDQINAALSGGTITLPDGSEHIGNFSINKPLTIQGKAKLVSPNADPALFIRPQTRDVTLRDLEITGSGSMIYDVLRIGQWETNVLADVPTNILIERLNVHGHSTQEVQRGIAANGANISILNSRIWGIHGKGYDTQAVAIWNGPGPLKIHDSYLEASGENFMAGGADTRIQNLTPSGIEIKRCHFFKPLSWKGVWSVKNLLELKHARNVLIDECLFENCWGDAQIGYALLFTVRNQDGNNPWAIVENVTLQNSVIKNSEQGVQTLGSDYLNPSKRCSGLKIYNNRFEGIKNWFLVLNGFYNTTIEHNTHEQGGNILVLDGDVSQGLVYRNNVTRKTGGYGFFGSGKGEGKVALDFYTPGHIMQGNVLAGMIAGIYPTGNFFPTDLSTISSFKGTDGLVPGYLGSNVPTPTPIPTPTPTPTPEPLPEPTPPPSPTTSPDGTKAKTITDSQGNVWTIGSNLETLKNNVHAGDGRGTVYKWVSSTVYVLGTDGNWYKWNGGWFKFGATEPGTVIPEPAPAPAPVPEPSQATYEFQRFAIPSTITAQDTLLAEIGDQGYGQCWVFVQSKYFYCFREVGTTKKYEFKRWPFPNGQELRDALAVEVGKEGYSNVFVWQGTLRGSRLKQ